MAEIVRLDDTVFVAGQITPTDIADIAAHGIKLIVNNRPDGEDPVSQPASSELEQEAAHHGLRLVNIQFPSAHIAPDHTVRLAEVLKTEKEPMLIFCRTGTRSTMLWTAAQIALGRSPEETMAKAAQAGYELRQAVPMIMHLAEAAQNEM